MGAALILLLGYMFRSLTQLDRICAQVLNLCSMYTDISMFDIFQKYEVYWHDLTTVKILLSRTLQTEKQQLIEWELSRCMHFYAVF